MAFDFFKKKNKRVESRESMVESKTIETAEAEIKPSVSVAVGSSALKSFHISEKSARGQAYNQYTFVIADRATKTDVKHAVQRAFKVNVTDVSIVRLPAKHRQIGRYAGATGALKKAIVTLKAGQIIAQAQP